jgi:hypothetical protein
MQNFKSQIFYLRMNQWCTIKRRKKSEHAQLYNLYEVKIFPGFICFTILYRLRVASMVEQGWRTTNDMF